MLALPPSNLFSTFGWPVEDAIGHEQPFVSRGAEKTPESCSDILSCQPEFEVDHSTTSFTVHSGTDPDMVKKLNHNASERDRRKKINSLFSSLRSLLPATDQSKKLSMQATVSRVLKYIPELQWQVEKLAQKKGGAFIKDVRQARRSNNVEQRKAKQIIRNQAWPLINGSVSKSARQQRTSCSDFHLQGP